MEDLEEISNVRKQQMIIKAKAERNVKDSRNKPYPEDPIIGSYGIVATDENNRYFVNNTGSDGTQYITSGVVEGIELGSIMNVQDSGRPGVVTLCIKKPGKELVYNLTDEDGRLYFYGYWCNFTKDMLTEV